MNLPQTISDIFGAWKAVPIFRISIPHEPLSVNRIYRRGRGIGLYKTKECKEYQDYIRHYAKNAIIFKEPLSGPLALHYTFGFTRRGRDADNPIKPIADCLQGVVYINDKQIRRFAVETIVSKDTPFVLIWGGRLEETED